MNNETDSLNKSLIGKYSISPTQRNLTISILLIFSIPSLICFLFIFYYFLKYRKRLIYDCINHHIILIILILDFLLILTELPITLFYVDKGNIQTRKICIFWIYWNSTLERTSLFLIMYASIERYLLIFFKHCITKYYFILHYIPMTLIGFYIPIIYFYLIVLSPCAQHHPYDITAFACGGACFFQYVDINTYDKFVDIMFPCLILLLFNLIIIIRVIIIRNRTFTSMSFRNLFKRNRRMIFQLLGISLMSLIAWMPWVVIIIRQKFFQSDFGDWFITYILHYLPYLTTSLSPFLALIGLPNIRKHLKAIKRQVKSTEPTPLQDIISIEVNHKELDDNTSL